jgi:sugar diacid utilization regulator
LEAYFERRQHRKATAAALDIHPNTLNHRFERIENLLGGRLDDIGWLAKLHTALRLHHTAS